MRQLRHLKIKAAISLRKDGKGNGGEKLQTLSKMSLDSCTTEIFNKAKNLITLGIRGDLNTLADSKALGILHRLNKLKPVYEAPNGPARENPLKRLPDSKHFPSQVTILVLTSTYLEWDKMKTLSELSSLDCRAHSHNLQVQPYTFRNEYKFLHFNFSQDLYNEYDYWLNKIGVHGLFPDFTGSLHRYQEWILPYSSGAEENSFKLLDKIVAMISTFKHT